MLMEDFFTHHLVTKMFGQTIRIRAILLNFFFCVISGAVIKTSDTDGASSCSQEMCIFLFDRVEEQSVRLHNLEAALLRTVSILISANEQNFSATIATLKSDPLINSLSIALDHDPVESFVLHPQPLETNVESPGRKKRQTETKPLTAKERLVEALKWSKKNNDVETRVASKAESKTEGLLELEVNQEIRYSRASTSENIRASINKARAAIFPSEVQSDVQQDSLVEATDDVLPTASPAIRDVTLPATFSQTSSTVLIPLLDETVNASSFSNVTLPPSSYKNNSVVTPIEGSFGLDHIASQKYVRDSIFDLQGAFKCAMGQLNDVNASEILGILHDPRATLNPNKTLSVQFELKDCLKYWVGVWIRVSVQPEFIDVRGENGIETGDSQIVLQIPRQCWKKKGNVFGLTLPSSAKAPCSFPVMTKFMECKVYSIVFIPIYFTLQGQPVFTEITVPPENGGNSTDLASLEQVHLANSTHMLSLKWSSQSNDCAKLMTSADLKIYRDGSEDIFQSYTIPSECLGSSRTNSFNTLLSKFVDWSQNTCQSVIWQPLDICRKYKLKLEPEYSSTWRGKSSSLEIFTPGVSSTSCCHILSDPSGIIQSVNDDNQYGCTWLISTKKNFTIYLTFSQFYLEWMFNLKIYDGPYTDSPLLLSQNGGSLPLTPIKSRSNQLFIQMENQGGYGYGSKRFTANYISVCNDETAQKEQATTSTTTYYGLTGTRDYSFYRENFWESTPRPSWG